MGTPRCCRGDRADRRRDAPSFDLVRAAALRALGRTRDPRAFEVLAAAVELETWNGRLRAVRCSGLAELADARAMPLVVEAARIEKGDGLRRAAVRALARIGALVEEERARVADELERLDDADFLVALEAVLPPIARRYSTVVRSSTGSLCRPSTGACAEMRRGGDPIRKAEKVPTQVKGLREDLDELREDQRRLQEKIEALART